MNFAFGEEDASKRTIRLQPTVSVGCYATDTCHIDLLASIPEGANNKQCNSLVLEGRRCGAQIHSENVAKTEVEIVVTPADSGQYLDREVYNEVHLRVPETLENKIWDNYALQPIGVSHNIHF